MKTYISTVRKLRICSERVRVLTAKELTVVAGGEGCAATQSEHSREEGITDPPTGCK
jgi:hypothetical protein